MHNLYRLYLKNDYDADVVIKSFKSHDLNLQNRNSIEDFLLKYYLVNEKMLKVDKENIKNIIDYINKYGYPGVNSDCNIVDVYLIFVHNVGRSKKMRRLVEKEYELGRVPELDYGRIKSRIKNYF